jgi:fibro-slime domain-containing protein
MGRRYVIAFGVVIFGTVVAPMIQSSGEIASGAPITLTAKVRDFLANGVEFEGINFANQTPAAYFANDQNNKIERGIVGPLGSPLGPNGDPVWSSVRDPGFYNTVPNGSFFNEWWQDVPGLNIPISLPLTFSDLGGGMYSYSNLSFFPIDGQGFGNEGYAHNYHFTMQIDSDFVYQPGQTVQVVSDDDLWVFINSKLAIDLGGVHGGYQGSVSLDSLGLTPGQTYPFDLFYAERNTSGAAFALQTDILGTLPEPSALTLIACGALAMITRPSRRV